MDWVLIVVGAAVYLMGILTGVGTMLLIAASRMEGEDGR